MQVTEKLIKAVNESVESVAWCASRYALAADREAIAWYFQSLFTAAANLENCHEEIQYHHLLRWKTDPL